jgi:molecular chaperone DnaK
VPKIEVTFDIDANGIVHVSAKDLGTGKEQKITITSASQGGGLSKEEVERMVKEADANAADDKKRRAEVEARNNGDSLVYQAEKTLKEFEGKADKALAEKVQAAIAVLKETLKGNDTEKIIADTEALSKPLYELTSAVYQEAGQQEGAPGQAGAAGAGSGKQDEKVVDAEYKVVDDEKK